MTDAVDTMKEYFQRKSRSVAPSSGPTQYNWFSAPPHLANYDSETINILLNIAKRKLARTFAFLSPFEAQLDTAEEIVLGMAAVGAVFCDTDGSDRVAKACYNDARRIALAKVYSSQTIMFAFEPDWQQIIFTSTPDIATCLDRARAVS